MSKTLYLIRGIPGSGKTTFAKQLAKSHPHALHYEADDWFTNEDGTYEYRPAEIKDAHACCVSNCSKGMANGNEVIIISNTFTRHWEMDAYFLLANEHGYEVVCVIMNNCFQNVHDVPSNIVQQMKERFEY
jgi:predicted kinase